VEKRLAWSAFALITGLLVATGRTTGAEDPHAYFDALIARPDHWKSLSLRPRAGEPVTSPHYENQLASSKVGGHAAPGEPWITYAPGSDSDPDRQDAAKVRIPAFYSPGSALASAIDASVTTIPLTLADSRWENRRGMKIDGEIMTVDGARVGNTVPVRRGQGGTQAVAHSAGATAVLSANSLLNQVRFPLGTSDGNTYLFTWDALWTSSFSQTGLTNHKAFQITSLSSGDQWFEVQTRFVGPPSSAPNPAWNGVTDVAAVTGRGYSQYLPPVTDGEPLLPMASAPFIINPNKWTRFWVVVEANREGDLRAFSDATTLSAPVASPSSTTISIDHPATIFTNPFTAATSVAGASWPGRSLKIDNEIMTIVSGPTTGLVRDLVVVRGAYGTVAAAHSSGGKVQLVNDYVSMYMADEDRNPVMLYSRIPMHLPINSANEAGRGSMSRFWLEFNTSTSAFTRGDLRDLVAYVRNFVALENPPRAISPLLIRPTGGVPPPFTGSGVAEAPTNLRIIR